MVTHHSDRRPVWSHWMVWHHVLSPSSRASVMEVGVVIASTPIVISATVITALTTGVAVTVWITGVVIPKKGQTTLMKDIQRNNMQLECTYKSKRKPTRRSRTFTCHLCCMCILCNRLTSPDWIWLKVAKKFPSPLIFKQSLTFNKVLPWIFFSVFCHRDICMKLTVLSLK